MKTKNVIFIVMVFALLMGTISVDAASLSATAANQPWTVQEIDDDEPGVQNLSTAFVGLNEVPMMSWSKTGLHRIYQAFAATSAVAGNCGPNDSWVCTSYYDSSLVPGTISNVATERYGPNSFGVKWAFKAGNMILGATVERMNDMSLVDDDWDDLVDLSKFDSILVGSPSLEMVGGHYRMAFTTKHTVGDFSTYKLVYMYYIGNFANSSCKNGGFSYQCDVIDYVTSPWQIEGMGAPSLQVTGSVVGIAYYKYGSPTGKIKYAYPWTGGLFKGDNCGYDPITLADTGGYRCINIWEAGNSGTSVKLAFGSTASDRGIAFTNDTTLMDALVVAEYVGSGGNCGIDGNMLIPPFNDIKRWECSEVFGDGMITGILNTPFSIAMDPEGYPVVAYQKPEMAAPGSLYIGYPRERVGLSPTGWVSQTIEGAPHMDVSVGDKPAISISNSGLGFIGYMVDDGNHWTTPLHVALQWFKTYLPAILR